MIGDKIQLNDSTYTIVKDITFGTYRNITKVQKRLSLLTKEHGQEKFEDLSIEKAQEVITEFASAGEEQAQIVADFIVDVLDVTEEMLNTMKLEDAITLFSKAYMASTEVKKKSEKVSVSPSSSVAPS